MLPVIRRLVWLPILTKDFYPSWNKSAKLVCGTITITSRCLSLGQFFYNDASISGSESKLLGNAKKVRNMGQQQPEIASTATGNDDDTVSHENSPDGKHGENSSRNLPRELNFVSRLNCTTGKIEWVELPEDYDFHQEIARSAYADMLHDHDRNIRYFQALRFEISKLKAQGEPAHVLDIGTGTGLLSMMAVVAGADSVFACDAFTPMLECAKLVVQRNGCKDRIKLIPKRSTELKIGVDIPYRCNVLVTEVFDTELIGEGAISTFNHAHKELLTETATVIPGTSTVYAQVVHSKEIEKWNTLPKQLKVCSNTISFPSEISSCPGIPSVQDLQLDAIKREEFTPLSPPIPIFSFDFTSPNPIPDKRFNKIKFTSEADAEGNAVFLWWDLDMDTSGNNILSCQPSYVKEGPSHWLEKCKSMDAAWRDHWMHSVYYIPRSSRLSAGKSGVLHSAHDEYSFWFDIVPENHAAAFDFPNDHPICQCGVHSVISRSQMYLINDNERYKKFLTTFERHVVPGETVCICISDCSMLPLILTKLGAKKIFIVESCKENERISREILTRNEIDLCGSTTVEYIQNEDLEEGLLNRIGDSKIDLVVGDPYFQVAVYPWNHLMFWYQLRSLNSAIFSHNVNLAPYKASLKGIAVHFTHLWKIRAPVNKAAYEFDLTDFDELIRKSSSISDSPVDAQPLWEYESIATSDIITLLEFNMAENPNNCSAEGQLQLSFQEQETNGIALWMDWELDSEHTLSTGPRKVPCLGKPVVWERFPKQGVYLFENKISSSEIRYKVSFDSATADFMFSFN